MAQDENEKRQAPSRLFLVLALVGLGLLVLLTDWVMGVILP